MKPFTSYSGHLLFTLILCVGFLFSSAQQETDSIPKKNKNTISGVPVVFYTPETRLGFGASGVFIFNFKNDTLGARPSTIYLGFAFTQNKQAVINLPFNLFLKNRLYNVYGELGYNHLNYNFYGVGNEVPKDFVERYGIDFPRLRLTGLRRTTNYLYAGLRYAYDKNYLYDIDSTGMLVTGEILGSNGGVVSGVGLVALFDTRDNIFYPSRGFFSELVVFQSDKIFGSDFEYTKVSLDASYYCHFSKNIFAFNFYTVYSNADLPFYQMANLGGAKKMRGFYEGRYRDNNLLVLQAEYRRHLFWYLGFTLFADAGQVAHRYNEFTTENWRYTYGAGLRLQLSKDQKINLRLDAAIGNGKILPYFTIAEAF